MPPPPGRQRQEHRQQARTPPPERTAVSGATGAVSQPPPANSAPKKDRLEHCDLLQRELVQVQTPTTFSSHFFHAKEFKDIPESVESLYTDAVLKTLLDVTRCTACGCTIAQHRKTFTQLLTILNEIGGIEAISLKQKIFQRQAEAMVQKQLEEDASTAHRHRGGGGMLSALDDELEAMLGAVDDHEQQQHVAGQRNVCTPADDGVGAGALLDHFHMEEPPKKQTNNAMTKKNTIVTTPTAPEDDDIFGASPPTDSSFSTVQLLTAAEEDGADNAAFDLL